MNKQQLEDMVGGRFFHVTFIKKDGSVRNMNARLGVKKYIKGTGTTSNTPRPANIVTVFDMKVKQYRAFDLDRVYNVVQGNRVMFGDRASSLAELI